jgi:hypothetical protein
VTTNNSPVLLFSSLNLNDRQNSLERLSLRSDLALDNNELYNTDSKTAAKTPKRIKNTCCALM